MKMPELLAPAGSPESLRAAVQAGAGAVYLGWGEFNARRSAKNFSDEEFAQALEYCHQRGVRVFLPLNTLISDRELPRAAETARKACRLGVDSVLVQDWGLFDLLRQMLPDLPLHASTQMSLFTSGGCREMAADGCERVVLARECSREDTEAIVKNCPAEVEIFAHGALCMCYSGQCAMSAVLGGRSGNRGRCAQPCRLPYGVNAPARKAYPLSLKDSCLAGRLEEMGAMGVSCVKLEGRMKRPEYVAVITRIYDPARKDVFVHFGLHTVCPTNLTVDAITQSLTTGSARQYATFGSTTLSYVYLPVEPGQVGRQTDCLSLEAGLQLLGVLHSDTTMELCCRNPIALRPGDTLIAVKIVD